MPIEAAGKHNEIVINRILLVLASEYKQGHVMVVAEVVYNHSNNSSSNDTMVKYVTFVLNTESSDELFVLNMSDTDPTPFMGHNNNNNNNSNSSHNNNSNMGDAYP